MQRLVPVSILVPFFVGLLVFSSTGADDAYITYWAAQTLASEGRPLSYNGEAVEQSSSLGHVFVLAGLSKLVSIPIPAIGFLLALSCGIGTAILTRWLALVHDTRMSTLAGLLAATSPCVLYWSFSGLETTLAAIAGTWFMFSVVRFLSGRSSECALSTALATLFFLSVRPEAIFEVVSVQAGLALVLVLTFLRAPSMRRRVVGLGRRLGLMFLMTAAGFSAISIYRLINFGDLMPQPVKAKVGAASLVTLIRGCEYVLRYMSQTGDVGVWIIGGLGIALVADRTLRRAQLCLADVVLALFATAVMGFVLASGGDWMGGGRFLVSLVPATVILALRFITQTMPTKAVTPLVVSIAILQLGSTLFFASHYAVGGPQWSTAHLANAGPDVPYVVRMNRDYYREYLIAQRLHEVVGRLRQQHGRQVSILTGQMGLAAYSLAVRHYPNVKFVDRLALTSRDFTECSVTASAARTAVGIELGYETFFAKAPELVRVCAIDQPDVIFDLDGRNRGRSLTVERNGYLVVYRQEGRLLNGSRWIPGLRTPTYMFIAVRRDLMTAGFTPRFYQFES